MKFGYFELLEFKMLFYTCIVFNTIPFVFTCTMSIVMKMIEETIRLSSETKLLVADKINRWCFNDIMGCRSCRTSMVTDTSRRSLLKQMLNSIWSVSQCRICCECVWTQCRMSKHLYPLHPHTNTGLFVPTNLDTCSSVTSRTTSSFVFINCLPFISGTTMWWLWCPFFR